MINIIPKPNYIEKLNGTLTLKKDIKVNNLKEASNAILLLKDYFNVSYEENGNIEFVLDKSFVNAGSYQLDIQDKIIISASEQAGFLYAIESLRQLLPPTIENKKDFEEVSIARVIIDDKPAYDYRGYMIDSSRHFFNKKAVIDKLDQMALFKLNVLHLHLSDDQGWRIDLPKYPKLKEIGSKRLRTKIGGMSKKTAIYDETPYEGIYSIDDIKEIVDHANKLCIEVIPEIDSPGHLSALLASYPEYSCAKQGITVKEGSGIYKDILCVGNEKAVDFMFDVLLEVAKLFPSKKIHVGGDEAPLDRIAKCPTCLKKMKELGFKNVLELKLDYTNKLAKRFIEKGYQVIGWNEVTNKNLPEDFVIQVWAPMNTKKAIDAINHGYKGIVSPFTKYYLDYSYSMFSLKSSYNYDPSSQYSKEGLKNILGFEAPAWAEYIRDTKRLDWQTFPRLLAMAESAWTYKNYKNYKDFVTRLDSINERLDCMGVKHTTKNCYLKAPSTSILSLVLSNKDLPSNIEYKKYNN